MTTEPIEDSINAAARIIGDISTGIYRSPANALKELVSNSFDAGATEVFINTDHPAHSSVTCFDNGPGISVDQLRTIFRYIGGSDKRIGGDTGLFGRPIVGRIGIGILAISQISKRFVIISSQHGDDFRIEVEVNIEEFETTESSRQNLGTGSIGRYRIYTMAEAPEEHYTIVTTPSGSELLQEMLGNESPRSYFARGECEASNFLEFVEVVSSGKQRRNLSEYQSFLWELASLCPVPYFRDGPVRGWYGWDDIKAGLEGFNFRLTVDGYELRKPVLLPTAGDLSELGDDCQVYPFHYDAEEEMGLSLRGYIFHQRKQIFPPELQGLLVRIRNVGITGYQTDMLKYPRNLGPMAGGMTGEVYVLRGLEEALNIDRNSFNETHNHFVQLQKVLFEHLGTPRGAGITTDIRARSRTRQEVLRQDRILEHLSRLARRLSRSSSIHWRLGVDDAMDSPLVLDVTGEEIRVNLDHDTVPSSQAAKEQFFRVCLIARLAEVLGPPDGEKDPLVGWLRKL